MKLQSFAPSALAQPSKATSPTHARAMNTQHLFGIQKDQFSLSRMGEEDTLPYGPGQGPKRADSGETKHNLQNHPKHQSLMSKLFQPFGHTHRH